MKLYIAVLWILQLVHTTSDSSILEAFRLRNDDKEEVKLLPESMADANHDGFSDMEDFQNTFSNF